MAPIGDGSLLRALGKGARDKYPIASAVVEALTPAVVEAIRTGDPEQVEKAAKNNPASINNLGVEKWWQSGTTLGMGGSLLTALGTVWALIQSGNYDPAVMGPLLATILASLFGLWRRWMPNLKPLFSRGK